MINTKLKYSFACIYFFAALLLPTSCIDEFEADIPAEETHLLAVEGTIYSDSLCNFYLTRSRELNTNSDNGNRYVSVNDAKLTIKGSDGSEYPLQKTAKNGIYSVQLPKLNSDVEYSLRIEDHGDIYESVPAKPLSTTKIESVEFNQTDRLSAVDVLLTTQEPKDTSSTLYYDWKVDETWEIRPILDSNLLYDPERNKPIYVFPLYPKVGWMMDRKTEAMIGMSVHYPRQQLRRSKLYDICLSDERIFYNYSGNIIQRAISKGEYEYKLACKQASSDMGGIFSPQAISLPSNIHSTNSERKAIGYVGVSMNESIFRFYIVGDSVQGKQFPRHPDLTITDNDWDVCHALYNQGFRLFIWENGPVKDIVEWAPLRFFDIRLRGAILEKPDYMP